jgi:cobalt-zinc-cadmium efflux system membrane fusion protein
VPPPKVAKDTVEFAAGSAQLQQIQSVAVVPRREATLRFAGRLVWDEDRTVRVFAPYAGRVAAIRVRPGESVKAGQTLAILASPDLGQAQSDARKAEQDYAIAQKTLARVAELNAHGVAAAKELQAAQADVARTEAERARTRERLKLYGAAADTVDQQLPLRSPIAGVVVERNLNPGQEVRPDNPPPNGLFVVSDPTHLWFMLDVAEADVASVHPGIEVQITTTLLGADRVTGIVTQVSDFVDPQTRTVKVRGRVDNADRRLKAELFVAAELKVASARGLLVPSRGVYLRGEQYFAFVDAGAGRFLRRQIKVGPATDGQQVVLEGLREGEKVVVDGNLLLEKILAAKD